MILIIIPVAVAIASDATHIGRLCRRETVFIIQTIVTAKTVLECLCIEIDTAASNYREKLELFNHALGARSI